MTPSYAKQGKTRLNLNLTDSARNEVSTMAEESGRSITELVRLALSILKVIIDERQAGHKLVVTKADGTPIKELIVPGF